MRLDLRRMSFFALGAVGVAGIVYARGRTATVRGATVTQVATAPFAQAEVALTFSAGARPNRMIIDLRSGESSSSATIEGDEESVRIPLTGALGNQADVTITAATRAFGRLRMQRWGFVVEPRTDGRVLEH